MMKKIQKLLLSICGFAILFAPSNSISISIMDSSTAGTQRSGNLRTNTTLLRTKQTTSAFNVSSNLPIGAIIAWPGTVTLPHGAALPLTAGADAQDIRWLECNGQTFSAADFPDLYKAIQVTRLPDLNGRFMRGATTAMVSNDGQKLVGNYADDKIKKHELYIPEHTHEFKGTITDSLAYGTAYGQDYTFNVNNKVKTSGVDVKFTNFSNVNYRKPTLVQSGKREGDRYGNNNYYVHLQGAGGHNAGVIGILKNVPIGDKTHGDGLEAGEEEKRYCSDKALWRFCVYKAEYECQNKPRATFKDIGSGQCTKEPWKNRNDISPYICCYDDTLQTCYANKAQDCSGFTWDPGTAGCTDQELWNVCVYEAYSKAATLSRATYNDMKSGGQCTKGPWKDRKDISPYICEYDYSLQECYKNKNRTDCSHPLESYQMIWNRCVYKAYEACYMVQRDDTNSATYTRCFDQFLNSCYETEVSLRDSQSIIDDGAGDDGSGDEAPDYNTARPTAETNSSNKVGGFQFEGTVDGKTEGGTAEGYFSKNSPTRTFGETTNKETLLGYHINAASPSDSEAALLGKYNPNGTETAPLHTFVKYYIRVR